MKYSLPTLAGFGATLLMTGCSSGFREGVILSETYEEKMDSYILRVDTGATTNTLIVEPSSKITPSPTRSNLAAYLDVGDTILFYSRRQDSRGTSFVYTHHIKKVKSETAQHMR